MQYNNLVGPLSYVQFVFDQNVIIQCTTMLISFYQCGFGGFLLSGRTGYSRLILTFPGLLFWNQPFLLGSLIHFEWIMALRSLLGNYTHIENTYIYADTYMYIYVYTVPHLSVYVSIYHEFILTHPISTQQHQVHSSLPPTSWLVNSFPLAEKVGSHYPQYIYVFAQS